MFRKFWGKGPRNNTCHRGKEARWADKDFDAAVTVVSAHPAESSDLGVPSDLPMGKSFYLAPHRQL